MGMIKWIKRKMKNHIANLVRTEVQKAVEDVLSLIPQMIEFQNSPKEVRQSYHDHTKDPLGNKALYANLKDELLSIGVPVEEVDIDVSDFKSWLCDFSEIKKSYQRSSDVYIEKCLEHYLSFRYLKISNDGIYIDIGASGSQWANILNKRGIRSYRLDLAYPEGIHGVNIGADAGDTKLPNAFASVLSAQCAYEHFIGDIDIRFVREAARILNEKGRYAIVPLYIDKTYFVVTSPYCNQQNIIIESEAKRIWQDDEYKVPFRRFYSPESFKKRIYSCIPESMKGKVLYFRNLSEVMKHYQGQRIYCFFMFYCEKR